MSKADKEFPFEETLARVEQLVEKMEAGKLTLEQSLASFEEGVRLTKACQAALKKAEQRVSVLMEDAEDDEPPEDFEDDDLL